jgi:hypothetical protein
VACRGKIVSTNQRKGIRGVGPAALYMLTCSLRHATSFAEAREIYAAAGDRRLTAGVLRDFADSLRSRVTMAQHWKDTVNHSL